MAMVLLYPLVSIVRIPCLARMPARWMFLLRGKNRAPSFAGYIENGESVLIFADLGKDKRGLHEIDSSDGSLKKTIYESEDFDVSGRTILNDKMNWWL